MPQKNSSSDSSIRAIRSNNGGDNNIHQVGEPLVLVVVALVGRRAVRRESVANDLCFVLPMYAMVTLWFCPRDSCHVYLKEEQHATHVESMYVACICV